MSGVDAKRPAERGLQERMNSPLELHEVRLRGLHGGVVRAAAGLSCAAG
jgi:hypothetical protein